MDLKTVFIIERKCVVTNVDVYLSPAGVTPFGGIKMALFEGVLCALVKPNLFSCTESVHSRVTRQPLPATDKLIMEK